LLAKHIQRLSFAIDIINIDFKHFSMIGLNAEILKQYLEYITNIRMNAVGLKPIFEERVN
jgi:ribonucleotide reductase beta subunit family protein with ferritin-like domain